MDTVSNTLEELGHVCTHKWWELPNPKPYSENVGTAHAMAAAMASGVEASDVFILLWEPNLYGALIEFGIRLGWSQPGRMFVVGAERESIFFQLPTVTLVNTIDDLIEEVGAA